MKRILLAAAALVVGGALAQNASTDSSELVRRSEVTISSPATYYVASGGNDYGDCSVSEPCRNYQPACNRVAGREISSDVVIQGTPGWSGTGCFLSGVRPGQQALPDGGVKLGTLRVRGARATYAPADGGSGSGTITAATAGNRSACAFDAWTTNGTYSVNELAGKWVTTDTDHLWPIRSNTAGPNSVLTIEDNGRAVQPTNGSTYQVYDVPSATITGGRGKPIVMATPEGDGVDVNPAFVITSAESTAPLAGGTAPKWITVEDFNVTGATTILADISGPVEVQHNYYQATTTSSQLVRALPGVYRGGVHRNILTGTGRFIQARFAATSALGAMIEAYDNYAPGPTNDKTLGFGSSASVWLEGNYFPKAGIRAGACLNCRSNCDTWGLIRRTGENDTAGSGGTIGPFNFDGVRVTGIGSVSYAVTVEGDNVVAFDQMGGPASTIVSPASGHTFAGTNGGGIVWGPSTVFDAGTGDLQVVFTNTSSGGGTVPEIAARVPPAYVNWDRSFGMRVGDVVAPARVLLDACQTNAILDFASALVSTCSVDLTITLACAAVNDTIELGVPNGAMVAGSQFQAWVSTSGTISVRHCCQAGTACDPASGTFYVRAFNP